jgi:hypothetical protein
MTGNGKRSSHAVAVIIAAIALMTPIRAQEPAQRGPSDGIKVHGHWAIDVRNADGTAVSHTEFENALAPAGAGGAWALSAFLSRAFTPGKWIVWLGGVPMPCGGPEGLLACGSREGQPGFLVSRPTPATVKLEGSATVDNPNATMINQVGTQVIYCDSTLSPQACAASNSIVGYNFTEATINPAITIRNGQIIQFSVVLSFS